MADVVKPDDKPAATPTENPTDPAAAPTALPDAKISPRGHLERAVTRYFGNEESLS